MANSQHDIKFNFTVGDAQVVFKDIAASLDRLNQAIDQLGQKISTSFGKGTTQAKRLKDGTAAQRKELAALRMEQRKLEQAYLKDKAWERQINKNAKAQQRLRQEISKTGKVAQTSANNAAAAQSKLNHQVSLGRQLFLRLRSVLLTIFGAYAIIQGIRNTINTVKDFELAMAQVHAISGATAKEMERLSGVARVLATRGIFNPTEIAGVQVQLAKFGFSVSEISSSLEGIIKLSIATGEELESAATLVSSSLRAMGMSASETQRLVDVLGASFVSSALDVEKFRESAKYVLPLARQMGWTIEQVAATLAKLADAGISGSLAGTGLRQTFVQLWDDTSELSEVLGTGIQTFDDFYGALENAKREGRSFSEVLSAVPVRAKTMFTVLWNGIDTIRAMEDSLNDVNGAIDEMANIQLKTLSGQAERFTASWQAMLNSIGESDFIVTEWISDLADAARGWARFFDPVSFALDDANTRFKKFSQSISKSTNEEKFDLLVKAMKDVSEQIIEQEEVVRDLVTTYENLNTVQMYFRGSMVSGRIKEEKAALAGYREELKLLGQEVENVEVGRIFDVNQRAVITATRAMVKDGANELAAFTSNYDNMLIGIEKYMSRLPKIMQEPYRLALGELDEWYQQEYERLKTLEETRLKQSAEAWDAYISDRRSILALEQQLELERNENLVQSEENRELEILRIKTKYARLGYELDLESGKLTVGQAKVVKEMLKELEETYQRETLEIKEKYIEKGLVEDRKAFEDRLKLAELEFRESIILMENAGVAAEVIKRKEIEFEIKLLKLRMANAEFLGLSVEEVKMLAQEIKNLEAEMAGIYPEDVSGEEIRKDIDKTADAYKRLAKEVTDYLEDIADAHVENTERIVDDLDTRIAETQRDLDRETELYTEGYANNVTAKKKELEELRKAREQAIKEREKAIKRQQALESLSQSISLGTAIADVLKTYAGIPGVGVALAGVVIGALLALFSSMKSKASSLAQYGEGGEINGKPHTMGGEIIEAEGGEFVVRKEQYAKYGSLIRAINEDNLPKLDANIINNTSFGKQSNVVVSTKEWGEIRDLLKDNLRRENVEVVGGKKIVSRGIKKRIINV